MHKLLLLISLLSTNIVAMEYEQVRYSESSRQENLELCKVDNKEITDFLRTVDDHLFEDITLPEVTRADATQTLAYEQVRQGAKGNLAGFYMVDKQTNDYKAFFCNNKYQILCKNSKCYERLTGAKQFTPLSVKTMATLLKPDQVKQVEVLHGSLFFHAQAKKASSNIKATVQISGEKNGDIIIKMPEIEKLLKQVSENPLLLYFNQKTNIVQKLAGKELSPAGIALLIDEAASSFGVKVGRKEIYVQNADKKRYFQIEASQLILINALLKDHPEALAQVKQLLFHQEKVETSSEKINEPKAESFFAKVKRELSNMEDKK